MNASSMGKNVPSRLRAGALAIAAGALLALPAGGQPLANSEPDPEQEDWLRYHLRKLERWGVMDLLRAEQQVDERQKQRAAASTHPEELALLATDEDSGVRFHVAANPHTPVQVLLELAVDPQPQVRGGVAMALHYDVHAAPAQRALVRRIAARLAADRQPLVRLALARNVHLADSSFVKLAGDPDPVVRQRLARNPRATPAALRSLAADTVTAVQAEALRHRNVPQDMLAEMSSAPDLPVRLAVASNPNTPISVLEGMLNDGAVEVRRAVAAHPATPPEALVRMAADDDTQVVVNVAGHPNAARPLLQKLAADPRDLAIRLAAQDQLALLLRHEIREDVLERWEAP